MGGPTVSGELIAMITNCHQDHKIMAWLSPAYPIGSYSFSHGLEEAITRKIVNDKETLHDWLFQILRLGLGRNDAILLSNYQSANDSQNQLLKDFFARHKRLFQEKTLHIYFLIDDQ